MWPRTQPVCGAKAAITAAEGVSSGLRGGILPAFGRLLKDATLYLEGAIESEPLVDAVCLKDEMCVECGGGGRGVFLFP